jgi:hypothetical protein
MKLKVICIFIFIALLFFLVSCGAPQIQQEKETSTVKPEYRVEGTIGSNIFLQSASFSVVTDQTNGTTEIRTSDSDSDLSSMINTWDIKFTGTDTGTYSCAGASPPIHMTCYFNTMTDYYSSSSTNMTITVSSYNLSVGGIIEGTITGKLNYLVNGVLVDTGINVSANFKVKITTVKP